ncbi:TadE/TadG family type IV pilus assembly protein [Streptomyces sp. SBT349]|uniref:TadE/TadG family type IV pilus assembly protein n=1 Tax=Streptomyces sp. SBT349 TaxID=1580539 RepID=UPI000A589EF3|nr:TadE/TadG family type IV pilus assembly protein [Streptomyces sp. SBT349]
MTPPMPPAPRPYRLRPSSPCRVLGDRGSASAELVLLLPVLLLVMYVMVYSARGAESRMRIDDAAHQAARAASQTRTPTHALHQAQTTATAALETAGLACRHVTVHLNGSLDAGSTVTVTLTCTVGLQDLALLPLPGSTILEAMFSAPVDVYRGAATEPAAERR